GVARVQSSGVLREPFKLKSHVGSFFVFLLLQPARLVRQQFAERPVRFAASVGLGRVDGIANELDDLCSPLVPLRFVRTHVIWKQRLVLGWLGLPPALFAPPQLSASAG